MRSFDPSTVVSEEAVRAHLAREFPAVPGRVIDAVLVAYRAATPTLLETLVAAHARIEDACAPDPELQAGHEVDLRRLR